MVTATEEAKILNTSREIIELLTKFFESNMTKEELRWKYLTLLKDWKMEVK